MPQLTQPRKCVQIESGVHGRVRVRPSEPILNVLFIQRIAAKRLPQVVFTWSQGGDVVHLPEEAAAGGYGFANLSEKLRARGCV